MWNYPFTLHVRLNADCKIGCQQNIMIYSISYSTRHKCMLDFSVSAKGLFSKPIIKPACNIWEWLFYCFRFCWGPIWKPFTIYIGNTMLHKQRNMWCLDRYHSIFFERGKKNIYIYIFIKESIAWQYITPMKSFSRN